MAHGRDRDAGKSARIAAMAQLASVRLDAGRAKLYFDLVMHSLSEAARRALQTMNPAKYEYQSDVAKFYIAQGGAEGEHSGRAAVVSRQLTLRFGVPSADVQEKIAAASSSQLDAIGERLLTAQTWVEALGAGSV